MKGIILAGGKGTRLMPLTSAVSKHLLPIYDKPMVYYPLSVLMLAGIREILIITNPDDESDYKKLLGDGSLFGVNIQYRIQNNPEGLVQAFHIGEEFVGSDSVCLILGDNFFWGAGLSQLLTSSAIDLTGATLFAYEVDEPNRYGVVEFDSDDRPLSLIEKPINPKSNFAVTGLYFYDNKVLDYAKKVKKSSRGEYEITSLNNLYLEKCSLRVQKLGRGFAWLDAGTHTALLEAGKFVETLETRQGYKIACLEEIALKNGWISKEFIASTISRHSNTSYAKYLGRLIE